MSGSAARLYEEDFVEWAEQQSRALRDAAELSTNLPLDWENLAEEIEGLADPKGMSCGAASQSSSNIFSNSNTPGQPIHGVDGLRRLRASGLKSSSCSTIAPALGARLPV